VRDAGERVIADLRYMCLKAAGMRNGASPTVEQIERAERALDWFRNRAPQPQGMDPGWGSRRVWIRGDDAAQVARYRRIYHLRRRTRMTFYEIADEVCMSPARVAHVCADAGIRKAEALEED